MLRNVVGEDPDAIVIADVGSPETFEVALRAAEGGRLVVAYLDSQGVVAALTRILNFYPDLRTATRACVAGSRAARRCSFGSCCPSGKPYASTVPATELLVVDDPAREVVRDGALDDLGLLLRSEGPGHSLDQSMLDLLVAGRVRVEDVFARTEDKAVMLERTRGLAKETN